MRDVPIGFIDMQIDGGLISMDTQTLLIVVLALALIGVLGWILYDRRRSQSLKSRFGPEYRRVVDEADDRRAAESELEARQRRVDKLDIRRLPQAERDRTRPNGRPSRPTSSTSPRPLSRRPTD